MFSRGGVFRRLSGSYASCGVVAGYGFSEGDLRHRPLDSVCFARSDRREMIFDALRESDREKKKTDFP